MTDTAEAVYETVDSNTASNTTAESDTERAQRSVKGLMGNVASKRGKAAKIIGTFAGASAAAAAIPLPFKDAILLCPIELAEVTALADVYEISREDSIRKVLNGLVELGAVTVVARKTLGLLGKKRPLPIPGPLANAAMAASMVSLVGAGATYAFEQLNQGNYSIDDLGIVNAITNTEAFRSATELLSTLLECTVGQDKIDKVEDFAADLADAVSVAVE